MSLAACGGDDGGTVTAIDAAVSIDAPNTDIDAPQATCTVPTAITEGAVEGTGGNSVVLKTMDSMGAPVYVWDWVPRMHDPSNPLVDYFRLVYPFPATMVGAARNLVDACTSNSDYCLLLNGDATITNGMIMETQLFFPDEGTMTITEAGDVNGGRFKATITGAKFNHYACDASGQCNLVEDGCSVTVANLSVDIAVTAPAAKLGSAVTLVPRRFHR
ncbi:MAG: hypothetical protein R3B06_25840 [Kofleriaceae bacterium]